MLRSIAKIVATVLLAAGCLLSPFARAQGNPSYQASIPFPFYISDVLLPAGTYQITQPAQNMLLFHNAQGVAIAYQLVFAKQEGGKVHTGQLSFTQYGSSYFLQEFAAPHNSSEPYMASTCVRGRMERRAANEVSDPRGQEVALIDISQR